MGDPINCTDLMTKKGSRVHGRQKQNFCSRLNPQLISFLFFRMLKAVALLAALQIVVGHELYPGKAHIHQSISYLISNSMFLIIVYLVFKRELHTKRETKWFPPSYHNNKIFCDLMLHNNHKKFMVLSKKDVNDFWKHLKNLNFTYP